MTNKVTIILVAIAFIPPQAAFASSACWSNDAVAAAKIVDFEVMLEMASNRCISEMPFLKNQYAKFNKLTSHHFLESNKILNEHFQKSDPQTQITVNHSEFILSTKKTYGDMANNFRCDEFSKLVDTAKFESFSKQNLIDLSNLAGGLPTIVGKRCANRMRLNRPSNDKQFLTTN
jgi:hypothetical protein